MEFFIRILKEIKEIEKIKYDLPFEKIIINKESKKDKK